MSRAITRASSGRRTVKPKRRAQPKRPPRPGVLDHAVAAIPLSAEGWRRASAWFFVLIGCGMAFAVASLFGVPAMVGTAIAEGIGRAGFRVARVEITGIERTDRQTVYKIALDGRPRAMPLVDLAAIRDSLVEHGGWIADARVSRRLPDTLVIDIDERVPAAIWQNNDQFMLIDQHGALLERVSRDAIPALPLVVGDGAAAQEPAYQRLIAAAPALRPMVKAASWIGNRRWDLLFESGETLRLPAGEAEAARALVRFAELDAAQGLLARGHRRFDLRDPTRLVILTRGETTRTIAAEDGE